MPGGSKELETGASTRHGFDNPFDFRNVVCSTSSPSPGRLEADRVLLHQHRDDLECGKRNASEHLASWVATESSVAGATSTVLGARIGRSQEVTAARCSA